MILFKGYLKGSNAICHNKLTYRDRIWKKEYFVKLYKIGTITLRINITVQT